MNSNISEASTMVFHSMSNEGTVVFKFTKPIIVPNITKFSNDAYVNVKINS
jgi:hypothetical protein